MHETWGAADSDMHGDLLVLAFNQACLSGDLAVASSLLQRLDAVLLGSAMAWETRESSLKLMRRMRDRLDDLREEARAERDTHVSAPHHKLVA
jgi:hypothetical protein